MTIDGDREDYAVARLRTVFAISLGKWGLLQSRLLQVMWWVKGKFGKKLVFSSFFLVVSGISLGFFSFCWDLFSFFCFACFFFLLAFLSFS